jgi:hypothetical protein
MISSLPFHIPSLERVHEIIGFHGDSPLISMQKIEPAILAVNSSSKFIPINELL